MAKSKRVLERMEEEKRLVLHTICMRMSEREALVYLTTRNHKMGVNKYYNIKEEIKTTKVKTLQNIALHDGLVEQHLDRIHTLEVVEHELWLSFNQETDNYKRASILVKIAEMQPYISGAYDMTRVIMEKQVELKTGYQQPEIRNP